MHRACWLAKKVLPAIMSSQGVVYSTARTVWKPVQVSTANVNVSSHNEDASSSLIMSFSTSPTPSFTTTTTTTSSSIQLKECDYDVNPSYLYQAVEAKQWQHVVDFLDSSQQEAKDQGCRHLRFSARGD